MPCHQRRRRGTCSVSSARVTNAGRAEHANEAWRQPAINCVADERGRDGCDLQGPPQPRARQPRPCARDRQTAWPGRLGDASARTRRCVRAAHRSRRARTGLPVADRTDSGPPPRATTCPRARRATPTARPSRAAPGRRRLRTDEFPRTGVYVVSNAVPLRKDYRNSVGK